MNDRFWVSEISKQLTVAGYDYKKNWYRLDNAATVFSFVSSREIPALFRISASLDKPINVNILQKALDKIITRFPYFRVNLRPGLFWYYFRETNASPRVILDEKYPCQEMPIRKKGIFPFRVRAYHNRIAVEFHHTITDGTGALTFLKALIGEYLILRGVKIKNWGDIFHVKQDIDPEEYEDAYKKNYVKDVPPTKNLSKAFHLPFKLERPGIYHLTTGIIPLKDIIKAVKERNVTITEFLVASYIEAIQDVLLHLPKSTRKKLIAPIRISVPINLRKIYPSKTMRNFSLWVAPGIDPRLGKFDFNEILNKVYHYMRTEINDKYIQQQIKRNVRAEINPLLRIIPLPIKQLFGKFIYTHYGEGQFSGSLTNLGLVKLPPDFVPYIKELQFLPGTNPVRKVGCAVLSYGENMYINFGNITNRKDIEKIFFTNLVKRGIHVKIETN